MPQEGYYLSQRSLVSQQDRAITAPPTVPRSRFTGSKTRKTTFNAGDLIPFLVDEVLPGDHLTYRTTAYLRMATPLFPLYDNQRVDTFYFFVPCRLVWDNWQRFMGEQNHPTESIDLPIPLIQSNAGGFAINSLADHFGIPCAGQINAAQQISVNALPFRCYNLIYNEWFRDQNLIQKATVDKDGATVTDANYVIRKRAKSHDYFTSALPWAQKFTAPNVPLGGQAPIVGLGYTVGAGATAGPATFWETGATAGSSYAQYQMTAQAGGFAIALNVPGGGAQNTPLVFANLAAATGVSINVFRQAFMIQQLLERDARGGTRYVEILKQHFGVTSPDFRLQRPEYIGGGQTPLILTPIAQTAPTAGVPLGALGAAGTANGQHRASYAATEHGYIIGLINVRSELTYQQGLHRMWTRATRYDFYWPELAGLGEQAILRQEIYCNGVDAEDSLVFGFQERWHEYRTVYSDISGLFRSTSIGTIDPWHLAQNFASAPLLNQTFIEDTPPHDTRPRRW